MCTVSQPSNEIMDGILLLDTCVRDCDKRKKFIYNHDERFSDKTTISTLLVINTRDYDGQVVSKTRWNFINFAFIILNFLRSLKCVKTLNI